MPWSETSNRARAFLDPHVRTRVGAFASSLVILAVSETPAKNRFPFGWRRRALFGCFYTVLDWLRETRR